jgi:hypothetical protein
VLDGLLHIIHESIIRVMHEAEVVDSCSMTNTVRT